MSICHNLSVTHYQSPSVCHYQSVHYQSVQFASQFTITMQPVLSTCSMTTCCCMYISENLSQSICHHLSPIISHHLSVIISPSICSSRQQPISYSRLLSRMLTTLRCQQLLKACAYLSQRMRRFKLIARPKQTGTCRTAFLCFFSSSTTAYCLPYRV